MNMSEAPAIIDSAYVRAYAEAGADIRFTGRQCIYVGGELAGPAGKLAICENGPNDFLLLLCDPDWNSFACAADESIEELLATAERWYEGIDKKWVFTHFSPEEDQRNMREYYAGQECSFCGRLPTEYENSFPSESAVICFECVERLHSAMVNFKSGA
jgi:hypothetical protein